MVQAELLCRTIATEREGIMLRRANLADARELFGIINRNRQHLGQFGNGAALPYRNQQALELDIIYPAPSGKIRYLILNGPAIAGNICLIPRGGDHERAELAAWLAKEFTGHGFVTIATKALAEHALGAGFGEIFAQARHNNTRSVNALLRSGFAQTGNCGDYNIFTYRPIPTP
jgi:RimJ/RimL family protein N-acetyltransferase